MDDSPRLLHLPSTLSQLEDEVDLFTIVTGHRRYTGDFFGDLRLSRTGGISEVGSLFRLPRYVSAVVFVVLLVCNTHNLLRNDLRALHAQGCVPSEQLLLHEVYLQRALTSCATPEFLIALFELGHLVNHLVIIVFSIYVANYPETWYPDEGQETLAYRRWDAVARLFRGELPILQAFSAMRTLQHVTPGVLTPEVQHLMLRLSRRKERPWKKFLRVASFFGLRLFYFFFGAEAFLVKLRLAALQLTEARESLRSLLPIFIFLNQLLGVVQLNLYTNQRLFRFIFGGVDNYLDRAEKRRMRVWNAAFQKATWDQFAETPGRFLAVSLTFNDADFQKLVLDDG